jgi:hypothetical protein
VYVGGYFTTLGDGTTSAKYIAKWNGSAWSQLMDGDYNGVPGTVWAAAVQTAAQKMFVGGNLIYAGPNGANYIAAFSDSENPLPVELTTFTAKALGNDVVLRWRTESEVNNAGFEIERGTTSWKRIGFVQGFGNSASPHEYSFTEKNLMAGKYKYRLKQIDNDGTFTYSKEIEVVINTIPNSYVLYQNYPNPFNPTTTITYQIPQAGLVTLKVYDAIGTEVATLVNQQREAGSYNITFNASKLNSGVYFYTLRSGDFTATKKLILVK